MNLGQTVIANQKLGILVGRVTKLDGQNVYIQVGNDPYKFHKDELQVINPDRYYLVKEILRKDSVQAKEIKNIIITVSKQSKSNKAQIVKMITDSGIPVEEQVYNPQQGIPYNGQTFFSARKGSTINRMIQAGQF
ncbi:hypothetical protein COF68_05250 [Bacillus toyonensis]|uniref:hypothetical protein n=1 Tax=Bacillus toyonensis TaxID=155322 RepID=UPI000BFCF6B0|nr:hypothetical protein [Bacillus toyonensis]PHE64250.1 hypothetical protein COF68_05250 [Bacillus toyonensis]